MNRSLQTHKLKRMSVCSLELDVPKSSMSNSQTEKQLLQQQLVDLVNDAFPDDLTNSLSFSSVDIEQDVLSAAGLVVLNELRRDFLDYIQPHIQNQEDLAKFQVNKGVVITEFILKRMENN